MLWLKLHSYTVQRDRLPAEFVCFRGTRFVDKASELLAEIEVMRSGSAGVSVSICDQRIFAAIPNAPFAYWVPRRILDIFRRRSSFGQVLGYARKGISTADNFRFLRLVWEISPQTIARSRQETFEGKPWVYFPKGGEYSPFYDDVHL